MKNLRKIASNGLIYENPTLRLVLGCCPTLALTTAAMNGLGMGIAVTVVLICSNLIISLLKNVIPSTVRIPAFILIIATFVTIIKMLLDKFLPSLYQSLGVYLPLIVVNCLILGRAESYASKNPVGLSILDGLFMGLGFTLSLTLMGAVRELLSEVLSIGFFGSSAGAFFTYGFMIFLFNFVVNKIQSKRMKKEVK